MINRLIILIIVMIYILNYPVLSRVFPDLETDYGQFLMFYRTRNILYELMFFWSFLLVYRVSERSIKAMATFGMVLTSGSLIDKAVFHISEYLMSDIILLIIALIASIKVYKENGTGIN